MPADRLLEWPYQVHTHPLDWDPDDGQRDKRCRRWLIWVVLWHCRHLWQTFRTLAKGVLGSWVGVGQVHDSVNF